MRRVHGSNYVLKRIVIIAAWAHALIFHIMLDLNIVKSILFTKLAKLLSNYILDIFVR